MVAIATGSVIQAKPPYSNHRGEYGYILVYLTYFSIDSVEPGAVDLRPKAAPINVVEVSKSSAAVLGTGNKQPMAVIGLIGISVLIILLYKPVDIRAVSTIARTVRRLFQGQKMGAFSVQVSCPR